MRPHSVRLLNLDQTGFFCSKKIIISLPLALFSPPYREILYRTLVDCFVSMQVSYNRLSLDHKIHVRKFDPPDNDFMPKSGSGDKVIIELLLCLLKVSEFDTPLCPR